MCLLFSSMPKPILENLYRCLFYYFIIVCLLTDMYDSRIVSLQILCTINSYSRLHNNLSQLLEVSVCLSKMFCCLSQVVGSSQFEVEKNH